MVCRKCKSSSSLTIRKEYSFCDDCFIAYIDHKFRACLGKSRKLRPHENVLVGLSGGSSSAALLNLVHNAVNLNTHKKLRINPLFLHVTEQLPNDEENKQRIQEQCDKYNVQLYVIDVSQCFSKNILLTDTHNMSMPLEEFQKFKASNTTYCDLLAHMKQNLFIRVAKELECKIIFTAETTTSLAVNLLSDIAIGRGSQIENNIGFCNTKDKDAQILRPMRDITMEEVDHYTRIKEIKSTPNNTSDNKSLQSIIQHFVSGLQENFPATLTTICKTADKISSADSKELKVCLFCKNPFQQDFANITAADATFFSSYVSSTSIDVCNPTLNRHLELQPNKKELCYCCQRHILELDKSNDHVQQGHLQALLES